MSACSLTHSWPVPRSTSVGNTSLWAIVVQEINRMGKVTLYAKQDNLPEEVSLVEGAMIPHLSSAQIRTSG